MPGDEIKVAEEKTIIDSNAVEKIKKYKRKLFALIRELYFVNRWNIDEISGAIGVDRKTVKKDI